MTTSTIKIIVNLALCVCVCVCFVLFGSFVFNLHLIKPIIIVTRYGILDHMQFFTKIEFLVSIDAQFIVDFNRALSVQKELPSPSYGLKIACG